MESAVDKAKDAGCPDFADCVFSRMGHCGRSAWEHYRHCELRAGKGLPQRSKEEQGMRLVPELVPESSWFSNLRSTMSKAGWDMLRKEVYQRAGHKCKVCGGKGRRWPVECHEKWEYDEAKKEQRLVELEALCPACHEVKHVGLAQARGRYEQALKHMCWVNGCSRAEAEKAVETAFSVWRRRGLVRWGLEMSYLKDFWKSDVESKSKEKRGTE